MSIPKSASIIRHWRSAWPRPPPNCPAAAVRVALGEELGLEPGRNVTGKMVAALRRLGFDYVFGGFWRSRRGMGAGAAALPSAGCHNLLSTAPPLPGCAAPAACQLRAH